MSSLLALLKDKKKQLAANNRKKTAKIPEGNSRWRIYPSWRKDGSDQFWHDFGQHFVKNAAGDMQAVYICVDKTFGKPCEICDTLRGAIKSASTDAQIELMKEAQAGGRILINATHLDGPNPGEVEIAEVPASVFEQVVNICTEWIGEDGSGENPLDPVTGKDFIITRTGKGKNTKYSVQVAAKRLAGGPGDAMSRLNNLDDYVAQESAEAASRALLSVKTVAGLLTAPSRGAGSSRLTPPVAATTLVEEVVEAVDDPYEVAKPPGGGKPKAADPFKVREEDITDVPDFPPAAAAPAPAPRKPAATPAPVAAAPAEDESSGDPELDDLLKKLG